MASVTPEVRLGELEGVTRRPEEDLLRALADPERPADAPGDEERLGDALVEPGRRHRAVELLEGGPAVVRLLDEREDRLGVDGHPGLGALEAVPREDLLVVRDDPVVDPDDRPVADRVVVGGERRMALGVVADVEEGLGRLLGHLDRLEQLARARSLLVRDDRGVARAVGVADRVRAALGDRCEQGLGRERPVDATRGTNAVSGYTAHTKPSEISP